MDELGKVMTYNLRFNVEKKISHFKHTELRLKCIMNYPITFNSKNLSMNWEKYLFHWEKNGILNLLQILCIPQPVHV